MEHVDFDDLKIKGEFTKLYKIIHFKESQKSRQHSYTLEINLG